MPDTIVSTPTGASRGVLYVATGPSHIRAAIKSALSVQRTNPGLPIHLFADLERQCLDARLRPQPFTSWANISEPHARSKVDYISQTPFDHTLYLDNDTRVLTDLGDAFDLLQHFDVALSHANKREVPLKEAKLRMPVPHAFPEYNTGIIFFRRNPATAAALERWKRLYQESYELVDQPSLREILWSGDLRLATLPPEYNVRFVKYLFLWSNDEARPKILHMAYYASGLSPYIRHWLRPVVRLLRPK